MARFPVSMRAAAVVAAPVAFLLWSGVGCAPDAPGPGAEGITVRDSAGVTIVDSRAGLWAPGDEWRISGEPTLRIGEVESANPAYLFASPRAVRRLSDGRIVMLESMLGEVRWFDPDGRHLATRGGQGEGPAEFNYAFALIVLPGDTVVIEDRPAIKHVFFGPDAEFVRTETLDRERLAALGPRAECADFPLPDRSLVICRPEGPQAQAGPGHFRRYSRFVRLPWTLDREDTLGLYGGIEQWGIDMGEGRTSFEVHPFHSRTRTAAGGDPLRIAIALNPAYSIEIWTPEGGLDRIVRRPGAEASPTPEQRAEARESFASHVNDQALRNRFLSEMTEPDTIPSVMSLVFGEGGELWVMRHPAMTSDDSALWDVFDPEGAWLGELRMPSGFGPSEIGEDYVLGFRMDPMGVPFIEMYRLERG